MRSALVCLVTLFGASAAGSAHAGGFAIPADARQIVVVTNKDWRASDATLQRWERAAGGRWTRVGEAVTVVVGHAGLGWGAGLDDPRGRSEADPQKKEGDRKAPAGVFAIDEAFGPGAAPDGLRMPYRLATEELICVDDAEAATYNRILDRKDAGKYGTAENMRRADGLYELGLVVRHNQTPITPGAGSCIFMHVWRAPGKATIGCTAMPKPVLAEIIAWLDPAAHPLLVQLPRAIYGARRASWRLP